MTDLTAAAPLSSLAALALASRAAPAPTSSIASIAGFEAFRSALIVKASKNVIKGENTDAATDELVKLLAEQLECYLLMTVKYPREAFAPSPLVDMAWRALLLHPRLYFNICAAVRAEVAKHGSPVDGQGAKVLIDHDPYSSFDASTVILKRYERSLEYYGHFFGFRAPDSIWPRNYHPLSQGSTFVITIKTLTSTSFRISAWAGDTIEDVKIKIELAHGLPPEMQRLIYAHPFSRQLQDGYTLSDYNIHGDTMLSLIMRLRGC